MRPEDEIVVVDDEYAHRRSVVCANKLLTRKNRQAGRKIALLREDGTDNDAASRDATTNYGDDGSGPRHGTSSGGSSDADGDGAVTGAGGNYAGASTIKDFGTGDSSVSGGGGGGGGAATATTTAATTAAAISGLKLLVLVILLALLVLF